MGVTEMIAAFATANAGVALSQSVVANIISPITAKFFRALSIDNLSEYSFAGLGIGAVIESSIQFAIVVLIAVFLVKHLQLPQL